LAPPASPWEGWLIVDGVLVFIIWDNYSQRFLKDGDNGQNNVRLAVERWKNWWGGNLHSEPFNTHCIGHGLLRNWCLSQQPSPWLEPLSSLPCDTVLSDKDDFNQFNNDTMSPHQKKVGVLTGGAVNLKPNLPMSLFLQLLLKKQTVLNLQRLVMTKAINSKISRLILLFLTYKHDRIPCFFSCFVFFKSLHQLRQYTLPNY